MDEPLWWKRGIIYQIYPRSFQDSNSDGIGDLNGIRGRLAYLESFGIDAMWISPIYPSPMKDFGYDVADYCDIDPIFGTLADFDLLIRDAHERGLKVILDFVPNHTSDQHPWFIDSRSSRTSDKRDWYIWHDPVPDGGPPNNWRSNFGGSGWEWDEHTGQYYYHAFLKEQPDLNWRNPDVRRAMYDVLRFWLERGVDGFRVDVIWHLIKDDQFRDNPPNPGYQPGDPAIREFLQVYSADRPEVHEIVQQMRRVVDEYPPSLLIGEIYLPIERLVTYYGPELRGAHLPFNFQLIESPWHARAISKMIREYEGAIPTGGWPNWVLSNHDQKRIATRIGIEQARIAAMLLLTLRGTPTLYYGDEIGMRDVSIPADRVRDPWEKNEPGLGVGRDPSRTPMQWSGEPHAGFTGAEPWLPVADDFAAFNVDALGKNQSSILTLYRRLIRLRRTHRCLAIGSYEPVKSEGDTLIYQRVSGEERVVIVLNFGREPQLVTLPESPAAWKPLITATLLPLPERIQGRLMLAPNEGAILMPTG